MEKEKLEEDATLTIPAGFVPYLRSGLFDEWGWAAEDIANLALRFGSRASGGIYSAPLQKFDTIRILLGNIGWRDSDAQSDTALNLGVGGVYVVEGLKGQHLALVDQLDEMPKATHKTMHDAASAKVAEFGEFVKAVEEQASRVSGGLLNPSPTRPTRRVPLERSRRLRPQH
jgi:hypothetical protein